MVQNISEPKIENQAGQTGGIPLTGGLNAAQFIVAQLAMWGVKRIYGVIGDANLYVLDELAKQNEIRYIACKHECGAALMASAEAKLTGRVSVCLATSGPGVANLLNGLADAAMDGSGVLAITGQVETSKIGTHTKQYIDQQQLLKPLTEQTVLVTHPDALPEIMKASLIHCRHTGRLAHISIPKDLYKMPVKGNVFPYEPHLHQSLLTPDQPIKEAADLISKAIRPVLLIGRGISSVKNELRELAEAITGAVVSTMPARSFFPQDHPLYAGGLGQAGSEASSKLLLESDLIVILGATWWPDEYTPNEAPIVQIDKNADKIGIGHAVKAGIAGDLRHIAPKLLTTIRATKQIDRSEWSRRIEAECRAWKARIENEANLDGSPIPPQRVMKLVSDYAARDAIIALDTGDHTLWFNRIFQAKEQDILISGRWRTLGFGLPAAISAQLIYPDRQVMAIVGDGGFMQTMAEFQTAVDYELSIVVIILNNSAYAMEKNRMEVSGLQTLGSRLNNPDFALIAQACGGVGLKAENSQQLEHCLQQAFSQKSPTIIDVSTADTLVPHTRI